MDTELSRPTASRAPSGAPPPATARSAGWTVAERLLLDLCRRHRTEPPAAAHGTTAQLFEELSRLAMAHGVHGLVLTRLEQGWTDDLFAAHRPEIDRTITLLRRQAAFWDLEQDRVLRALRKDGFEPLVLKGAALRRWVYASPVERVMGDLDILVSRDEVAPVLATLSTLGYRSEYPDAARAGFREHLYHDRVAHPNGFEVEVHWGLTRPDAASRLDPELFQRHARLLDEVDGVPLRVPSGEDMILHTVSQSEQDGVRSLRRLVDFDRVVAASEIDWDRLSAEADRAGLAIPLSVVARLAECLLGTSAPEAWTRGREIGALPRRAIAVSRPVDRLLRPPTRADVTERQLFHLWCLPGWRSRGKELVEIASGRGDPLRWVWEEEEPPDAVRIRPLRGLWRLAKLGALQLTLLGRWLSSARPGPTGSGAFWRSSGAGSPPEPR